MTANGFRRIASARASRVALGIVITANLAAGGGALWLLQGAHVVTVDEAVSRYRSDQPRAAMPSMTTAPTLAASDGAAAAVDNGTSSAEGEVAAAAAAADPSTGPG